MPESPKSRRQRRRFDDDFKAQAVRLVLDEGKSVGAVARDLDLTETALRAWVHRARESHTGPHRAAVRTFERAGVPRLVAMSIVGHKTESIYRRYAIVDEAMQREAAARLDAWMAARPAAPSTATVTAVRRGSRFRRSSAACGAGY